MNDRFKFRIWYEPERKMMLFNNPALIDGEIMEGGLLFKNYDHSIKNVNECKPEDFKLMQCTGLKDKNGKLIYEVDIVVFYFDNDEIVGVISWSPEYQVGFYVNTTDYFKDKYVTDYELLYGENYEVIGNIYENPELLEVEQ